MNLEKPRRAVVYVSDAESLENLLQALDRIDAIGLDAERASGFRYTNQAYLIQIATRDNIYLVDPVAEELPSNWDSRLAAAMEQPAWILHSATQDLPCLAELGIKPSRVIDTELAARFLGVERFGLASLAEQFLDLTLAKEHSAADWSQRPLNDSMLNYAALDVDILFELWEKLEPQLQQTDRRDWLDQELERLVDFKPKPASDQPWRNLPGMTKIKDLKRQQIALSLWRARDELARKLDVAPGRLIPDRSIAAVVANPPKSKTELAANKEFHGRASRSKLEIWWNAISSAKDVEIEPISHDLNHIPNHRSWEKRFPEAHQRLSAVRPLLVAKADELGLAVELILTPDTLRRICFEPAANLGSQLRELGARQWQIELCEPLIRAGLEQQLPDPAA